MGRRYLFIFISLSLCMLAMSQFCACSTRSSSGALALAPRSGGGQAAGEQQSTERAGGQVNGGGGLPDDDEPLDGGGGGLGVDAQPTVIQSLFDYNQPGLAPWGPVVQVLDVVVSGQHYAVHELAHFDPFTKMYQLPNGDIVFSNEPLEDIILQSSTQEPPPLPPSEYWDGPGGETEIFSNQILVSFDQTMSQQQVADLLDLKDLHVIFSDFEPPDPGQIGANNANAWFWFEFQNEVFPTFQDAYDYFLTYPHVIEVEPNEVEGFHLDYTPVNGNGYPSDTWYAHGNDFPYGGGEPNQTRHIQALGIDTSNRIRMGPPYGGPLSSEYCVAVIDTGVWRWHDDFTITGDAAHRKISKYGVTCNDKTFFFGTGWGMPPVINGRQARHGTMCAGTITATTYDSMHYIQTIDSEVPSCAPQCGVFPIGGRVTSENGISPASAAVGLAFIKDCLKYGFFS